MDTMKLLHIDASILGANSASRQLSGAVVGRLRKATPGLEVAYRDLAAEPHLTGAHLTAAQGATPEPPSLQQDIAAGQALLQEFLAADTVVIGAPMYNFTIPSQPKAWIDCIVVAGKTFAMAPPARKDWLATNG
jgi:FMN-dependent NADH-azoreductase